MLCRKEFRMLEMTDLNNILFFIISFSICVLTIYVNCAIIYLVRDFSRFI